MAGRLAPRSQLEQIRGFFDAEAREYLMEREEQPSFAAQRELVLSLLPRRCGRILDVGCGPAMMAPALLLRADEVHGIDASPEMVAYGRARMLAHPDGARCRLAVGDAERLEFAEGVFDAAISMGVIEYLLSYDRALAEMHRVLRPGGTLVLTIQNRLAAYRLAREAVAAPRELAKRLLGRPPSASRRFITNRCVPWRLNAQLERAGFRDVRGHFCNYLIPSRIAPALLGNQYVVKAEKPF